MYETSEFHLAVVVYSDYAQRTPKRRKNISHAMSHTSLFLPCFDLHG